MNRSMTGSQANGSGNGVRVDAHAARSSPGAREPLASSATRSRLREHVRFLVELFSDTGERFSANEGFRLVAAFSYYATFSIFPLLLLSITVVGFVLGESDSARERLLDALANEGSSIREVVDRSLSAMQTSRSGRGISAVLGLVTLLFAASGAFVELDAALNKIWCIPPRESKGITGSIRLYLRERLQGFAVVAVLGLTLLVSLVSSSVLQSVVDSASKAVSTPLWPALLQTANVFLSMAILSFVFTLMFHLLPRSRPPMSVVARGAILTTVLLLALKELFATYLGKLTSYSAYGVAGGVLALATYIYVSSVIIFFGAQLTEVLAEKRGEKPCAPREMA